jgi:hypothetical protein
MFGMVQSIDAALAQLDAALDALAEVDPTDAGWSGIGALVQSLHARKNRLDAHVTRATGAFSMFGDPEGARNTAAWLTWRCRMSRGAANAELRRAWACDRMPAVAAAYLAGEITSEHVQVLAKAQRLSPEAFAKAEDELLDAAKSLRFTQFARHVEYFRQLAEPDVVEEEADAVFARRAVHCSRTFDGVVVLDGTLDAVGGTIVKDELERLEHQLFEADWADVRARLGDAATVADLARTPAQRRHDAMVLMAQQSRSLGNANLARPLFTVHVGYETFAGRLCQLADGTVVTPGQLVPWLTDADVERIVFDGPSRVIDVGRRQRLFTGGARRAVEARDLECTHPSCDEPYQRCDVDHIQRWEHGGETNEENGRIRCPHHNPGRRRERRPRP